MGSFVDPQRTRLAISTLLMLTAGLVLQPRTAPAQTSTTDRLVSVATLQTALERNGFSPGFIDGRDGSRTRGALLDYCQSAGVSETTGRRQLLADSTPFTNTAIITTEDIALVGKAPADWLDASALPAMACTSLCEVLSEKFHVSQPFLARLNPAMSNWNASLQGTSITVPSTRPSLWAPSAARLEIDCGAFRLRAFDTNDRLIASFPCSVAREAQRIPTGVMTLGAFAPNPNYTFDPVNFPESPRAQEIGRKLILPPGPNNPVGVYWISLSQPGFGIHGTPKPETIGRPESHGCFRMTNWDILTLSRMVTPGTPVKIIPPPRPDAPVQGLQPQ